MTRVLLQAVLSALVLGAIGAASVLASQPLLVPSLGASVLLQVHLPEQASARPWNTAIGQLCGVAAGYGAVLLLGAAAGPSFTSGHPLLVARVAASALAVAVALVMQTALGAVCPAGGATALIASLGLETADRAGLGRFVAAILLVTALGEGARRLVLRLDGPHRAPAGDG